MVEYILSSKMERTILAARLSQFWYYVLTIMPVLNSLLFSNTHNFRGQTKILKIL